MCKRMFGDEVGDFLGYKILSHSDDCPVRS